VSDLGRNARLVFTAWTPAGAAYGGTSVPLFGRKGALATGLQKLRFYVGSSSSSSSSSGFGNGAGFGGGDGGLRSSTPGEARAAVEPHGVQAGSAAAAAAALSAPQLAQDYGFALAKAREAFETGSCARVPWLNAAVLQRADAAAAHPGAARGWRPSAATAAPGAAARVGGGAGLAAASPLWWCADDFAVASECWLEVELPTFAYPVVHEERRYQVPPTPPYPKTYPLTPRLRTPSCTGSAGTRLLWRVA
jgi:hypothetical protein